jgi:hypothetical protein
MKAGHVVIFQRAVRGALLAVVGLVLVGVAAAAPRKVAVVSLIGDKLEIVYPQMTTGSRLDQNVRHALEDRAGEFDRFTLGAAAQAIAAFDPTIATALIAVGPSRLREQPDLLFDGKQVGLPGAVVDELERQQAQYVLVVSKLRDDVKLQFIDTRTGIGSVRGLGFYLDEHTRVRLTDTRAEADGLLAPFAYFRVSLVDVRTGLLVREQRVTQMDVMPVAAKAGATEPWQVLDAEQKVKHVEGLIRKGLKAAIPPLLEGL